MNASSCIERGVVSIPVTAAIRQAAKIFVKKHIGPLPVVDEDGRPVGVIGLRDPWFVVCPVLSDPLAALKQLSDKIPHKIYLS